MNLDSVQYTYTIKFLPTGQMYHGSRTAEGCHPSELWVTYFTSSNIVKDLIKKYGEDSFTIIDIEEHPNNDAYDKETKFLVENNCSESDEWLNMSNNEFSKCHSSELVKSRMLYKYGVEHNMQLPFVREKISKANKEHWKNPEYRKKRKRLYFEKHGVTHHMHNKDVVKKIEETCISKYGVNNVAKADKIKAKIEKTFIDKYGKHPRQTKEVKAKQVNTLLEKYGVKHYSHTDDFKQKINETWENKTDEELEKHRNHSKNTRANDPIFECPHCGRNIKNKGNFNRWHNDNCRQNKG